MGRPGCDGPATTTGRRVRSSGSLAPGRVHAVGCRPVPVVGPARRVRRGGRRGRDHHALVAGRVSRGGHRTHPLAATDQPAADIPDTEVFLRYKAATASSRGPLAVAPIFLRDNRRITALITIIWVAVLIFYLIEHEARRSLVPDAEMIGFYIDDRRAGKPTGWLILQAFGDLRPISADKHPSSPNPDTSNPNFWDARPSRGPAQQTAARSGKAVK